MCAKIYFSPSRVPFLFSFFFNFLAHISFNFLLFSPSWGRLHINKKHQLKLTEMKHSKIFRQFVSTSITTRIRTKRRSFEAQVFAATALEIYLKSTRGFCAKYFLSGKNFSGLPETTSQQRPFQH